MGIVIAPKLISASNKKATVIKSSRNRKAFRLAVFNLNNGIGSLRWQYIILIFQRKTIYNPEAIRDEVF